VIIFGLVRFLLKKVTKPKFILKKKNRNRVKPTGFGSVRFGFLGEKPVQTGLARFWLGFFRFWLGFFFVWLGFFGLALFFRFGSVLARFFVGFSSVRFFWFFVYKTEPAGFFKNLIGFFLFGFFGYFFPVFSV
jgi:hypothetical protein